MAYENGDLMKNYLGECLERYEEDNNIFEKALNLFNTYSKRVDWPYCIEDLDRVSREILGTDIINITFGAGRYMYNEEIKWDGISDKLKKELRYFYNLVSESYNMAWFGRFNPNGFYGIAHSITRDNKISLRIVKNNAQYIELEDDLTGIKHIMSYLQNIVNKAEKEYAK